MFWLHALILYLVREQELKYIESHCPVNWPLLRKDTNIPPDMNHAFKMIADSMAVDLLRVGDYCEQME